MESSRVPGIPGVSTPMAANPDHRDSVAQVHLLLGSPNHRAGVEVKMQLKFFTMDMNTCPTLDGGAGAVTGSSANQQPSLVPMHIMVNDQCLQNHTQIGSETQTGTGVNPTLAHQWPRRLKRGFAVMDLDLDSVVDDEEVDEVDESPGDCENHSNGSRPCLHASGPDSQSTVPDMDWAQVGGEDGQKIFLEATEACNDIFPKTDSEPSWSQSPVRFQQGRVFPSVAAASSLLPSLPSPGPGVPSNTLEGPASLTACWAAWDDYNQKHGSGQPGPGPL